MERDLIRPAVLTVPLQPPPQPQNPTQNPTQNSARTIQMSPQELEDLVRRITSQFLSDEGPRIVRDYMNPAHEFLNRQEESY